VATVTQTAFCRGDGGFGGPARAQPRPYAVPEREPDFVCDIETSRQAALIYRLSGDLNPLHADPKVAAAAGYPQPILHGLATYGIAGRALLKTVCGGDPDRLAAMSARFSAPVFPGETFRTEIWRDGDAIGFQVRCLEREVLAITNGRAELRV
jgi:acyl dehydratase